MIDLYSMDFVEFITEIYGNKIIEMLQDCYNNNKETIEPFHSDLLKLYRTYLCIGAMPDAINNFLSINKDILKFDSNIISNIIQGYINDMKKYVKDTTETVKIENIYNSIPSQIGNKSGKFSTLNV